jgi:DNA-binding GntR family transcriptional regulator
MGDTTPKYQHIKQYLIQGILSRAFVDCLPSENRLAQQFGVSRMTARRALADLELAGSVERIPGKGSFVRRNQHYTSGFFRVRPFRKWAQDLNAALRTEVLEARTVAPPAPIAAALRHRGRMILLRILNYLDEKPVRYAVRYLRADRCRGLLGENLAEASIHELLIHRFGLPLTQVTQTMTAIGLPAELASVFREPAGFPMFHFRRLMYSFRAPITYVEYFMRGEMAFQDTFTPRWEAADFQTPA